jgi:hypothetical protein
MEQHFDHAKSTDDPATDKQLTLEDLKSVRGVYIFPLDDEEEAELLNVKSKGAKTT